MTCTYPECRMQKVLSAFVLLHYMLVFKVIYIRVNIIGKTPTIANIESSTYGLKSSCFINYISTFKSSVRSSSVQKIKLELVRDGDIEQNTGPLINFKHLTHNFSANSKKLQFFNVNAQSLVKKRSALANKLMTWE